MTESRSPEATKRPWLAAVLAFIVPGMGHLYVYMWGRALLWFALYFVSTQFLLPDGAIPDSLSLDAMTTAASNAPLAVSLLILTITALNVVDAYLATKHVNQRITGPAPTASCPHCGKDLDEDLEFCHWCTTQLDETEN